LFLSKNYQPAAVRSLNVSAAKAIPEKEASFAAVSLSSERRGALKCFRRGQAFLNAAQHVDQSIEYSV
jgi:hypothetical protein